MSRFDRRALLDGASVAAFFAVPIQVVARLTVNENTRSGWAAVVSLLIMMALVLGAGVAAWHQRRGTPLSHGLVCATGVFVVIQAVFTLVKLLQGHSVSWGRIVASLGLSMVAGIIGGFCGASLLRRGVQPQR
jgi:hypothetical protein